MIYNLYIEKFNRVQFDAPFLDSPDLGVCKVTENFQEYV